MLTPYLLIGQVLKPQGVRGEAKLRCDASEPDTCLAWTTLYLKKGEEYTPIGVRFSRVQDGIGYALSLESIIANTDSSELVFRPLTNVLCEEMNIIRKKDNVFSKAAEKFLAQIITE